MNKKAQYLTAWNVLLVVIVVMGFFFTLVYLNVKEATITIERPYQVEYNSCLNELEQTKQSKIPECPEVICRDSPSGVAYMILFIIVFVFAYLFLYNKSKKIREAEEKLEMRKKK